MGIDYKEQKGKGKAKISNREFWIAKRKSKKAREDFRINMRD
jgi:hypothetical protein